MSAPIRSLKVIALWWLSAALAVACLSPAASADQARKSPPNILFFILDDVGIDQMEIFGYGGDTPPRLPNINAIAESGVKFSNFWAMPECSPSRALMFEGRYPIRTNVTDALLSVDLANSQVSPYETTTPRILKHRNYESGLFGKFHLTGSNLNATASANNPLGYTAVYQLGWDYFAGWQDGAPHPIDTTAGGVAPPGISYSCGFIPGRNSANGADEGACYQVDNSCEMLSTLQGKAPGRACLESGGIFVPASQCQDQAPATVDFSLQNGYYAGELVINNPDGTFEVLAPEDPSGAARGYRSVIESDRAIDWINTRPSDKPWMASVSYSSAHTPYHQAPASLLAPGSLPADDLDCGDVDDQRVISNQMIEAMDTEIGRVLVETGVATMVDGVISYDPAQSRTMIVIMGDNGTYAPSVKAPFNPVRSKGSVYQTGVWTPLIVAGPLVKAPGRSVEAMVNVADVFQLFGEIAGLNVHKLASKSRPIDSVAMLPYLKHPKHKSLRKNNFATLAGNIQPEGYTVPPCVLEAINVCVQLFPSQELCASEGGAWWGEPDGSNPPLPLGAGAPLTDCCGVNAYRASQQQPPYTVQPGLQQAMRNDAYKLVRTVTTDWDSSANQCATTNAEEFYAIDENHPPRLDNEEDDLLAPPHVMNKQERKAYRRLSKSLDKLLNSVVACEGDGNLDGVVDTQDIDQYVYWDTLTGELSSWYDFNYDGLTNVYDIPYITDGKFPGKCPKKNPKLRIE